MKLEPETPITLSIEPETPITLSILNELTTSLQLSEEIPSRLLYRALRWSYEKITDQQNKLSVIREVIKDQGKE